MPTVQPGAGACRRMTGLIGTTLGDRYLVERKLGEGGFGTVYAARHLGTQATVAIKVLTPELSMCSEVRERFQDEVRLLGRLTHPHIVQIHDCGETAEGLPFFVMEFLCGEDLESRLTRVVRMPLRTVIQLAEQAGSAILAAHQAGIVHRDIKPNNLFLVHCPTPSSGEVLCKVLDFGIAKLRRATPLTAQNALLGTPAYMAPEAIQGQIDSIDSRSDQWSLAVVIYRALTGRLPFDGPDIMSILYQVVKQDPPPLSGFCPLLPPRVEAAVARALAKDKTARFASIADFISALRPEPPASEPSPGSVEHWLRRASLGGLAVSLLVTGSVVRIKYSPPQREQGCELTSPAEARTLPAPPVGSTSSGTSAAAEPGHSPGWVSSPSAPASSARAMRPVRPGSSKNMKPIHGAAGTSKGDIDALFGHDYLDLVSEHPNGLR